MPTAPCGLVLFLHLEKTGGTWVRERMESADNRALGWVKVYGPCEQALLQRTHWHPVLQDASTSAREVLASVRHERIEKQCRTACDASLSAPPPRVCYGCCENATLPPISQSRRVIEYHSHNWKSWFATAPLLRPLRRLYRNHGCSFTAFTVLRSPPERALSHYAHFLRALPLSVAVERIEDLMMRRITQRWAYSSTLNASAKKARVACEETRALQYAESVLDSMDVVGLFEVMDGTLREVGRHSGLRFPRFSSSREANASDSWRTTTARASYSVEDIEAAERDHGQLGRGLGKPDSLVDSHEAVSRLPPELVRQLDSINVCDEQLYRYALTKWRLSHASRVGDDI
jgi:hypothetical protein